MGKSAWIRPWERNRMSLRAPLLWGAAGFAACGVAFLAFGLYILWDSPRLINFLAAWIPFVLSVLFAFVPSGKEIKHPWIKWGWRSGVVVVGFFWSIMLWHQQDLSDKANAKQTQEAIGTAVSKANAHADPQFTAVQSQVADVRGNLAAVEKDLESKMDQSTSAISTGIAKVGKPEPPETAKLVASLWEDTADLNHPVTEQTISPDSDGNYPVSFTLINVTDTAAKAVDFWVQICSQCAFAREPDGFVKNAGISEQARTKNIQQLNPGANLEKQTIIVRNNASGLPAGFEIAIHYSCETCGKMQPFQKLIIHYPPSSRISTFITQPRP